MDKVSADQVPPYVLKVVALTFPDVGNGVVRLLNIAFCRLDRVEAVVDSLFVLVECYRTQGVYELAVAANPDGVGQCDGTFEEGLEVGCDVIAQEAEVDTGKTVLRQQRLTAVFALMCNGVEVKHVELTFQFYLYDASGKSVDKGLAVNQLSVVDITRTEIKACHTIRYL